MEKEINVLTAESMQTSLCCAWLAIQKKTKTINRSHTSYFYKHVVERWCGTYISNECFISAVKIAGIPMEESTVKGNYYIAISKKLV